jgi:hypothetical protein
MAGSAFVQREGTIDLSTYQWKSRLLFIFAPSQDDERYRGLRQEMREQEDEIIDRDLLVFHVFEDGESWFGDSLIDKQSAAHLRDRFSVTPGQFTVVLVGKDGGEKLRQRNGFNMGEIFALIDSMPMRQREMLEGSRGKSR